jgi:peptidoglycan/LPS O-acetylase OafA/YrhL
MDNILIQAVVAAMFAKVLVDAVKTTPLQTVGWVLVVLAFLFGELSAFLVPRPRSRRLRRPRSLETSTRETVAPPPTRPSSSRRS